MDRRGDPARQAGGKEPIHAVAGGAGRVRGLWQVVSSREMRSSREDPLGRSSREDPIFLRSTILVGSPGTVQTSLSR